VSSGDPSLSLALSPLLQPLRFATRAGVGRLNGLEALVARVVEQARAYATPGSAERLDRLAASVRGFDDAAEAERQKALAALVRELGALLPIPLEISALAQGVSGSPGKLAGMPAPAVAEANPNDPLATPAIRLRGVGPALAEKLEAKGLRTVGDLLLNLPRRYEDRRKPRTVAEAPVGERSVIAGRILKVAEAHGRRRRLEVLVRDTAGGTLVCIWFHYRPSFLQRFPSGAQVLVSGEVREGYRGGGKVMHHPDVELMGSSGEPSAPRDDDSFGRVVPVYSDVEGVPPRTFRRIEKRAVDEYVRFVEDLLPESLRKRRQLLSLGEALREAHFPETFAEELARGVPSGQPESPEPLSQALPQHAAALAPQLVLAMGPLAAQSLLQSAEPLGRLRGRAVPADPGYGLGEARVIATYHPAYLLRNPADKARAWADLCLAAEQLPGMA